MKKKQLVLVCGVPGSGKSYLAKRMAKAWKNCVYLDKDDVTLLTQVGFEIAGREYDRRSDFFNENFRDPEYDVTDKIALSAAKYNDFVIVNAPYTSELRREEQHFDCGRFKIMKDALDKFGGELVVVWIDIDRELLIARLKDRYNHDADAAIRDASIADNIEGYVDKLNLATPELSNSKTVSKVYAYDASRSDEPGYFESFLESMK